MAERWANYKRSHQSNFESDVGAIVNYIGTEGTNGDGDRKLGYMITLVANNWLTVSAKNHSKSALKSYIFCVDRDHWSQRDVTWGPKPYTNQLCDLRQVTLLL